MQFTNISRKKSVFLALTSVFLFLHFSSSHPTNGGGGYTSAPGDQTCLNCHNTGSINGDIQLTGIPALVTPGDTYPITVTINNTVGTASRAGFQMVALNTDMPPIVSVGTFSIPAGGSNLQIKQANNKSYIGHSPAKTFGGNTSLTYDIEWTAPTDQDGEEVKFYGAALLANGSGPSGDRFLVTNTTTMIESGMSTPLVLGTENIMGVLCNGESNGQATVTVTGGSPNYTYAWNNGENTATATMLSAGNHTVTVTDMGSQSEMISVMIPDADLLTAGIASEMDALCNGENNGTAEIQGLGGTGNLLYNWSNSLTGPIQNNLLAGAYTISVTDDNGCQVTVSLDINEPAAILLDVVASTDPTCSDSDDGSIEVAATGGFGNITYTWSPNIGNQFGGEISNIPEGDYMVTAVDQNNCSTSTTISLFGPSAVTATFTNVVNETCAMDQDGGATVVPGGGAGNYTVTWSNGSTSLSQSNLAGAVYFVTVTDSNGCTADASVTIENGSTLDIDINIIEQPACGNTNGALEVVVLNTTNPPTYLWNVGSTTAIVGNLGSGMYSVTATDGLCSQVAEIDLVEINNLEVEVASVVNVTCNGAMNGGAALNITGGMSPYDVEWSDGSTETSRNDLSGGSYIVSISDSQGCMDMVMIDIAEPIQLYYHRCQ